MLPSSAAKSCLHCIYARPKRTHVCVLGISKTVLPDIRECPYGIEALLAEKTENDKYRDEQF